MIADLTEIKTLKAGFGGMVGLKSSEKCNETGAVAVIRVYCLFFIMLGIWAMIPLIALAEDGSRMIFSGLSNVLGVSFALACFLAAFGTHRRDSTIGYGLGQILILASLSYLGYRIISLNIEGEEHLLLYFTSATLLWVLYVFRKRVGRYFVVSTCSSSQKTNIPSREL